MKMSSVCIGAGLVLASSLVLAACSAPAPATPGLRTGAAEAPSAWLGSEPHLVLVGKVNGVEVRIQAKDGDALLANLKAKREFQVNAATKEKRYTAFEVSFGALMEGLERELELEFENADFAKAPGTLTLVNEANKDLIPEGLTGDRSNLELEWEWEDAEKSSFSSGEVLSVQGQLVRGIDEPSKLGGFFTATFADGQLTGSFTAVQVEEEADDVDAFYN